MLIGISCKDDANDYPEGEVFVQSVQVPDTVSIQESFEIEIELVLPDPCWSYSRLEKQENGTITSFQVFAKNTAGGDIACPTRPVTEKVKEQITLTYSGSNDLIFNGFVNAHNALLTKTIFVTN